MEFGGLLRHDLREACHLLGTAQTIRYTHFPNLVVRRITVPVGRSIPVGMGAQEQGQLVGIEHSCDRSEYE